MKLHVFFAALFLYMLYISVCSGDSSTSPDCPRRRCGAEWHPVCGSNKVTYFSQCDFDDANCQLHKKKLTSSNGDCSKKRKGGEFTCVGCPDDKASPVCATNGTDPITFRNSCYFDCYKKQMDHQATSKPGDCPSPKNSAVNHVVFMGKYLPFLILILVF